VHNASRHNQSKVTMVQVSSICKVNLSSLTNYTVYMLSAIMP